MGLTAPHRRKKNGVLCFSGTFDYVALAKLELCAVSLLIQTGVVAF